MDRSGDSQMPPLCLCGFPGGGMMFLYGSRSGRTMTEERYAKRKILVKDW
jgi:hypothetical protein